MRWARENPDQMEEISRLPLHEQNEALRAAISPLIERTTVTNFSPRGELVKDRAARIVDGTYTVWKVAHGGEGFALDLTTSKCALCGGSFSPVGWAYTFHDQYGTNLATHGGCFRDAPNWAEIEYDDSEEVL